MTTPQTKNAPAGIVLTPGVDDVLERIEQEEDFARERKARLEGYELTATELAHFQEIFSIVLREVNKRLLSRGIVLGACSPNPRGFGAVFLGVDRENRRYDVTLGIPNEERLNMERLGRESFVRELIGMVCEGVLAKREEYLRRGGMSS